MAKKGGRLLFARMMSLVALFFLLFVDIISPFADGPGVIYTMTAYYHNLSTSVLGGMDNCKIKSK